jgi:15-cis-phytoene desaturase
LRGVLRLSRAGSPYSSEQATNADLERYGLKIWQYLTSCTKRRDSVDTPNSYGRLTWWQLLGGDAFSPKFQVEVETFVRTMIAMDAKRGNARTIGNVGMQLLLDAIGDGSRVDRVLNGPTSDQWILPWESYLRRGGVKFIYNSFVKQLRYDPTRRKITRIDYEVDGEPHFFAETEFDYVVAALPLEVMKWLMMARASQELLVADPKLAWIADVDLEKYMAWMAGIQFYLQRDVPVVRGHVYYPEAAWKLSSVSQAQFWGTEFFRLYGMGRYRGILSVDVCDWRSSVGTQTEAAARLTASECSREEAANEIWAQLRDCLLGPDGEDLLPKQIPPYNFDESIRFVEAPQPGWQDRDPEGRRNRPRSVATNGSPYFVPPPGSHLERPRAISSGAKNLFLAGDYVETVTDLATMEASNEAGRRAVNAILDIEHRVNAERCELWPFEEPPELEDWKKFDEELYNHGEPHIFEVAGIFDRERGYAAAAASRLAMGLASSYRRGAPGTADGLRSLINRL